MTCGDQHHGVALPDDDGSVRLLRQLACLDRESLLTNLNLTLVHKASMGSRSPVQWSPGLKPRLSCVMAWKPALQGWRLLSDPEPLDELGIAVGVLALQVVEKATPLPHELQQTTAGVMILGV